MSSKAKGRLGFGGRKSEPKGATSAGSVSFSSADGDSTAHPRDNKADNGTADSAEAPASRGETLAVEPSTDEAPFLRSESGSIATAAVAAEPKPNSAKASKRKAPKRLKAKAGKKPKVDEEISLPVTVAVDFYRGVTKVRDAEQIARAFVEKNFDAPNASYVFVQKWRDGCAVEMQEGGGKAYLPELLAKLDEDEDALVALPMSGRVLQVRLDEDTKMLEALVLTAGQLPAEGSFVALPTRSMTPIDKRGSKVFIAGMGLLAASMIALVFSVGAFFIDTKAWALPYMQQTRVQDLPSAQSDTIQGLLATSDCIAKLEFMGGKWNIVPGWDDGNGLCSSSARPVAPPVVEIQEEAGIPVDVIDGSVPAPIPGDLANPAGAPAVGSTQL